MLSDLQIGYLAGILDGEGCVTVTRNVRNDRKKRRRNYELRSVVTITQRRRRLLDHIVAMVGTDNASIYRHRGSKLRDYFILRFTNGWLRDNLPLLIPHLVLKHEQAGICLWFLSNPGKTGLPGMTEDEWAVRDSMFEKCRHLNADRSNGEG